MSTLTIRNLDDEVKTALRVRAATRQRSMEEEARHILRDALQVQPERAQDLGAKIRARFASLGGVQLVVAEREAMRPAPDFAAPATPSTPARARRRP